MTLHFLHFCHTMHSCLARRWRRRCGRRRNDGRGLRLRRRPWSSRFRWTAFGRMCARTCSLHRHAPWGRRRGRRRGAGLEEDDDRIFKPFMTISCVTPLLQGRLVCILHTCCCCWIVDPHSPFMTTLSALEYSVFLFILSKPTLYI